jgi:hypothetical protein
MSASHTTAIAKSDKQIKTAELCFHLQSFVAQKNALSHMHNQALAGLLHKNCHGRVLSHGADI